MAEVERHPYDVVVIGAGGAGLRAVIEARERGLRVAVICKSLFGKAHTVMAEGGCAAAMGNANPKDNWQVHFKDTMWSRKLKCANRSTKRRNVPGSTRSEPLMMPTTPPRSSPARSLSVVFRAARSKAKFGAAEKG